MTRYKTAGSKSISRTEYEALGEFRYQIRRFLHFSEEAARAAGVEPQQHQLLLAAKALERAGTPTIKTLAVRLQIQHHSMVELVASAVSMKARAGAESAAAS